MDDRQEHFILYFYKTPTTTLKKVRNVNRKENNTCLYMVEDYNTLISVGKKHDRQPASKRKKIEWKMPIYGGNRKEN